MVKIRSIALALVLLGAPASAVAAKPAYLEVTLDYRPLFDSACADATQQPLNAEAVKELQSRLGEFQEF